MSRLTRISERLHRGDLSIDFVGKRKVFYAVSVCILLAAIGGYFGRGLHMGIEFKGGAQYTISDTRVTVNEARDAANKATGNTQSVVKKAGGRALVQITGTSAAKSKEIEQNLSKELNLPESKIDSQLIGPTWGGEISQKAWEGLIIFMVLVVVYLAIAFEWRMAAAAFVALLHDLLITIGVYALVGFEVTSGTIIGLLTILGYSLYDTVVVFDTVRENTRGITKQSQRTYSEAANHGLNQTLVRSVNTTVVALLPVAALLFIGGGILGAGMLNDISLALFVGLLAGAYSSICVATPFLATLKEAQPEMKALTRRVLAKRKQDAKKAAEQAAQPQQADGPQDAVPAGATGAGDTAPGSVSGSGADRPRGGAGGSGSSRGSGGSGGTRRQPNRRGGRGRPSGKKKH
ncbi:protein-export membrane protein SecF [Mangrovactinospora gilvigrisea]|uniref:Protein-export membrane protein SecF n=1 Tax=Mangrovactinospora gilvigrisea TaxID=1428644 RepID=A0A1J7CC60_9ACTN|nr:protein translocase subunit SecF [Mangrovactinospora gilvigrisea]OIV39104.1 protein-export membrane protein SecF [Mangrovactinospora gilvigrisea]